MSEEFSKAADAERDAITDAVDVYQKKVSEYCKRWEVDPVEQLAGTKHVHNVLMFNDSDEGVVLTVAISFTKKLSKEMIQKLAKRAREKGRHVEEIC